MRCWLSITALALALVAAACSDHTAEQAKTTPTATRDPANPLGLPVGTPVHVTYREKFNALNAVLPERVDAAQKAAAAANPSDQASLGRLLETTSLLTATTQAFRSLDPPPCLAGGHQAMEQVLRLYDQGNGELLTGLRLLEVRNPEANNYFTRAREYFREGAAAHEAATQFINRAPC